MNTAGNQKFHKVVIIGAGPGGLCMAIKLLQAGIDDFAILEKASGLGGTWHNNIFPGLCCDVPSHLYSFSFEPKRDWTQPYPAQPEILEYLQGVAAKYKIEPYIQFDTRVTEARWSDETSSWTLATDRGEICARVVVSQAFDVTLIVISDDSASAVILDATLDSDSVDFRSDFEACMIEGSLEEASGSTFRCPMDAAEIGAGRNTLDVTIELSDGSTGTDSVTWKFFQGAEP